MRKDARLDIVDERPEVGDYVIIHAGFALHRIDPEEAKITLEPWKEMGVLIILTWFCPSRVRRH